MIDRLRDQATRQWERNRAHRAQLETVRRLLVAFAFGAMVAMACIMTISTAAQHVARPVSSAVEGGLIHE
jgi:alpha/beta superfamily hydrolase